MKSVSKLAYLSGWLFLWSVFVIGMMNVTQWVDEEFVMPTMDATVIEAMQSHRVHLKSLWLWESENVSDYARLEAWESNLNVLNGLFVWGWNVWSDVSLVVVWWWDQNGMYSSSAWIAGWFSNTISVGANNSAIGGGANNTVSWENGVVAWWNSNTVWSGWGVVVGWWNNNSGEYWVVVWGSNNSTWRYWLSFGHSSRWGERSFSWNDWSYGWGSWWTDNSAYIGASGWVLIWTYTPKSGVNLVVNGAVKIGWESDEWRPWEIKMFGGCFYAYDGNKWHVLGKSSMAWWNCSHVDLARICGFWSTKLLEWDIAIWYSAPYAPNCNSIKQEVTCGSDGNLNPSAYSYPYCYSLNGEGGSSDKCDLNGDWLRNDEDKNICAEAIMNHDESMLNECDFNGDWRLTALDLTKYVETCL